MSLYLVKRYCMHDVAMQTAKPLLIETPRASQAGFGIVPLKPEHNDDTISAAQEVAAQEFSAELSTGTAGAGGGDEPAEFCAAV